jgi:Na+/proline symporter
MLLLQAGAALRGATLVFVGDLGFDFATISVLCVAVIGVCVFAGGLRGAAAIEAAQGGLLLTIAFLLLAPALVAMGGWEQVEAAISALDHVWTDAFAGKTGVVAIAFAGGGVGLGLAMTGQPHALNRFMAARDEATLRRVRWAALAWIAVLLAVVLAGGWAANLLYAGLEHPEQSLFAIASRLLPPWLSAIMSTGLAIAAAISIAGPLFAIATSLAVDLRRGSAPLSAPWMRTALLFAAVLGLALSAFGPAALLEQTLFSFTTLGAALGPLVLVRLSGKRIRPGSTLGAMWSAFVLSLLFHLLPDSPGDFLERVLPFVAALGIALSGGERRRNPDRADRGQETVHDRIPI